MEVEESNSSSLNHAVEDNQSPQSSKKFNPNTVFLKYRWQPFSCTLPRFNRLYFLEKLRGEKIMFLGDSLSNKKLLKEQAERTQALGTSMSVYNKSKKGRKTENEMQEAGQAILKTPIVKL
ncbi:hypothetical protein ACFX1W_040687 [Malus domestica]